MNDVLMEATIKALLIEKDDDKIILTNEMLRKVPLPDGDIVFDQEIPVKSFINPYGREVTPVNGKIRVVISDYTTKAALPMNYWVVNGYYLDNERGYSGYTSEISKDGCSTVDEILDKIVIKGEFRKHGQFGSGIRNVEQGLYYPTPSENQSKDNLIKSAHIISYGYRYLNNIVWGELFDNNWFIAQATTEMGINVFQLDIFKAKVTQKVLKPLISRRSKNNVYKEFYNSYCCNNLYTESEIDNLIDEIELRWNEFKSMDSIAADNRMDNSYD